MHKIIESVGPEEAPVAVHYLLLCRVIVSSDPMSEAAHWLKAPTQSTATGKTLSVKDQKRLKAARVHRAEFVYPEYLMLCKLVRRTPQAISDQLGGRAGNQTDGLATSVE